MGVDIIGNEKRRPAKHRNMPSVTVPRAGLEYANWRAVCVLKKALGQLVQLGFDVAAFTPAAYRRPRLGRP